MSRFAPVNAEGFYFPTSARYDAELIKNLDIQSPQFKDFLVDLGRTVNEVSFYMNQRAIGLHSVSEQVSGKQFFPAAGAPTGDGQTSQINRQAYFKTIDFGVLPVLGATPIPHDIDFDADYSVINIYGAATKPTVPLSYIPLPYSSPTANENIELEVDATNVIITTAIDYSTYTICYVVIEYLKN